VKFLNSLLFLKNCFSLLAGTAGKSKEALSEMQSDDMLHCSIISSALKS